MLKSPFRSSRFLISVPPPRHRLRFTNPTRLKSSATNKGPRNTPPSQLKFGNKPFEEPLVLYLLRMLGEPFVPLSTIFDFHGDPPQWAGGLAHVIPRPLQGISVPVDGHGEASKNPGIDVVQYADSIEDVLHWIENPDTTPAILLPIKLFGPDVMIRCKILSSNLHIIIMGTKTSFDAKSLTVSLTALHEDHWFKDAPERQKLIDALGRQPILRFVAGYYPIPPNLTSTGAKPVDRALNALGPNVALAILGVDGFRARFIGEDEARNVLPSLRQSLARKGW